MKFSDKNVKKREASLRDIHYIVALRCEAPS